MILVDTSGFLAVLNADEERHADAKRFWITGLQSNELFVCTNYTLIETIALVQRRLGMSALNTFQNDIVPILRVEWVDEVVHRAGVAAMLAANRRKLSLVDCVSFEVARQLGIRVVFTLDNHFREQGFTCRP